MPLRFASSGRFVAIPSPCIFRSPPSMAAAFGLTPAETRLLASMFAGRSLAETAATLCITRPTAKTHLEHIFLKTGVTRQAELMRLWTGLRNLLPKRRRFEISSGKVARGHMWLVERRLRRERFA
jgi:DNA-binding CsgD family transcriptional regulator